MNLNANRYQILERQNFNIPVIFLQGSHDVSTSPYVEFRVWKQGRVNMEALIQKLRSAVKHAHWDLITEYNFLPRPLAVPAEGEEQQPTASVEVSVDEDPMQLSPYELGTQHIADSS